MEEGSIAPEARATVNFWADTEKTKNRATVYVKNSDSLDELVEIIYDPGVGTLASGQIFRGWTTDPNYTADTTPKTIADIRTEMEAKSITEGDVVDYYAMIFQIHNIAFQDEYAATIKTDQIYFRADGETPSYTINEDYVPSDPNKQFEGWFATGTVTPVLDVYPKGTTVQIASDVVFSVDAPTGAWLSFNENGKGASYTPPQFIGNGETTVEPAAPTRRGYTFGGWYTGAPATSGGDPTGTLFVFEQELETRTDLYAKWIPVSTASYTVIIWRQNITADGYDFEESISLTGNTGSTVSSVTSQGTGNNRYARINNQNKQYTGFHLDSFDTNVTIAPEGNTVVNVYYNRNQHTLTFQEYGYTYTVSTGDNDNNPNKYGDVNGQKARVYWNNGAFRTTNTWNGTVYTGTVYTRSNGQSWHTIKTITALYQQNISDNFPIVGSDGTTYTTSRWDPQSNTPFNQVLVYIDVMPDADVTFHQNTANHTTKHMHYYVEALPGETPTRTYNGKGFVLYKNIDANYGYFTEAEDYISLIGFSKSNQYPPEAYNNNNTKLNTVWNNGNAINVYCYYLRDKHSITFLDGTYFNGDGVILQGATSEVLHQTDQLYYQDDITSYNEGEPNYYDPNAVDGYTFSGWYLDSDCTHPATFNKMPEGGVTVYAKWVQTQYRVFLHPNVPETESLEWGQTNQQMNFRVTVGEKVSGGTVINGDRAGRTYELIGWFTDPSLSNESYFNFDTQVLNDSTVPEDPAYDKTTDYTDNMNKYGRITDGFTNSDVTRPWITRKLDLYAKWREVLLGAKGINVVYDPAEGYGQPNDTLDYLDNSDSIAQAGSMPNDTTKQFKGWVLQTWNGSEYVDKTGDIIYPGDPFTVLKADAKQEIRYEEDGVTPLIIDGVTQYKYTVKLKAVYDTFEAPVPTYINWYQNDADASGPIHTNEEVQINKTTSIYDITSDPNFTAQRGRMFLGWAKKEEYAIIKPDGTPDQSSRITYYEDLTEEDLFLKYDSESDKYLAENSSGDWVEALGIAADEKRPYDALYAVWTDVFYVVHGNGTRASVEVVKVTDTTSREALTTGATVNTDGTVSYDSYYYGGYAVLAGAQSDADPDGFTLTKGGTEAEYTGNFTWSRANAAKDEGAAFDKDVGDVYYLKEVPTYYLPQPKALVVKDNYGNGNITSIRFLTVTDTNIYKQGGVFVNNADNKGTFAKTFTLTVNTVGSTTYTPEGLFENADLTGGYFTVVNFSTLDKTTYQNCKGYWLTYDNIKVYGIDANINDITIN